ncbi:NTF2-related export protein 2-like [Physella acuta]|uniref:NTF2-related export protein 2-like n=1 Tax=Physella acuta TaxID=109671 RepID=UPI0027DE3C75|nr:NTF2-related export protein 2-like [Physella acuta]
MDIKVLSSQATIAIEEFAKLYFETFDKRRQAIVRIYQDKANLVWNGHAVTGADEIMKFFDTLPSSEFHIEGMDTQAILPDVVADGSNSIIVNFFGKVKFKGSEAKAFFHTFILSAHENKWKIVTENFRFLE